MGYATGCDPSPPRVNYFSNPDISYLGRPTGTATDDNARCIEDNMVRRSTFECSASATPTSAASGEPPTAYCFRRYAGLGRRNLQHARA